MLKYTLVPQSFFVKDNENMILSELVQLDKEDKVEYKELPDFKAVLVYAHTDGAIPEVYSLLERASSIKDYNKVLAYHSNGYIHIVIAVGKKLLLCNSFEASDIVTAEYFIFASVKKFQINPEVSTIYIKGGDSQFKSELFRYFKGVESL